MYCIAAVLAPTYLSVFGSGYHQGLAVVIILCLAMLVASGVGFVDVLLLMAGRTTWNLVTTLTALAVDVLVDIVLIPHIGITGAAVGWCAAILAANVVPLILVWTSLRLDPFGAGTLIGMLLSVVCFAALPLLSGLALGGQLGRLIGVGVGFVLFAGGIYRFRSALDLTLASAALKRKRG